MGVPRHLQRPGAELSLWAGCRAEAFGHSSPAHHVQFRRSYQFFDSMRAESEEGSLRVRWLARVHSHDHHGMSKELKGSSIGLGWGRGQITMSLQAKNLLGKEEM